MRVGAFACTDVYASHVHPERMEAREGVGPFQTGVTVSCELLRGCLELNLGPPSEQQVLLTAELSICLLLLP